MEIIKEFFTPFIGQVVWQVRRGHGSFLTMEFGMPHLLVREPRDPKPDTSARVKRSQKRRLVSVTGDWHFWVQYGDWKISTPEGTLTSENDPGSPLDECLRDLDGQKLVSVDQGSMPGACVLKFDLGAIMEIWPSTEIPDDQWSLYGWDGDIVICRNDGVLVFEKADRDHRVFKPLHPTWPSVT